MDTQVNTSGALLRRYVSVTALHTRHTLEDCVPFEPDSAFHFFVACSECSLVCCVRLHFPLNFRTVF